MVGVGELTSAAAMAAPGAMPPGPLDPAGKVSGARRRHNCRFCPKAFVTPSKLKRHERVHTGDKPYSCGHCSQRFTQRCGLKAHSYLHAREALTRPTDPNQP